MSTGPAPEAERQRVVATIVVYNEVSQIGWVLDRFANVLADGTVDQVLAVDDGSTDGTAEVVEQRIAGRTNARLITHPQRQGVGDAIRSGYRFALENEYDVFVIMAGNGKDDPEQIPQLIQPILHGEADYVQGSRFAQGGQSTGLPRHRTAAIHAFTWVFSVLVGHRFTDCTNGFRAYRTELLRDPRVMWDQSWLGTYELEYYIHYKAVQLGYRIDEVPVSKIYRHEPGTSYSKMRARDWFIALKPLVYLRLGIKK